MRQKVASDTLSLALAIISCLAVAHTNGHCGVERGREAWKVAKGEIGRRKLMNGENSGGGGGGKT